MTALTILQGASSRLGLSAPSAVFSSTDAQIIQLRNLMNEEGAELADWAAWTKITKEKTFTTTAAAAQVASVPDDFGWLVNDTMWNRTTDQQIVGPISAEQWQMEQAVGVGATLRQYFRFRGTGTASLLLGPGTPTASETVAYEYVSTQWCEASGGTDQSAFAADTDVSFLPEHVITLGVIWRFLKAKGFDYGEDFRKYEMAKSRALGRDGGKPRLRLEGGMGPGLWHGNIPEGNWTL